MERMLSQASSMGVLTSLIVSRRDSVLVEEYYRGLRPSETVNVKSVSKTLLSPMVGIAIRDGLLEGVDQPVSELLPDYYEILAGRGALDPRKNEIAIRHLLSMRAGIETASFGNYGAWAASPDWAYDQLRRPMVCDPDECHEYSTGNTHLLSVILTRRSGKSLRTYMLDELFRPMGIALGEWDRDPQGRYLGGNNMSLRPRDMLKFGQLFANGGRFEGRQLVPEEWIATSWRPTGSSPWNGHGYGYLWWMRHWGGERAYFAWGYGGQFIVVVPRLDLVIVATSSLRDRERGHTRQMWRFFDRYAVPAFKVGWGAESRDEGLP
jgi:CubicO group peptidase (beta-lactamase class C family)